MKAAHALAIFGGVAVVGGGIYLATRRPAATAARPSGGISGDAGSLIGALGGAVLSKIGDGLFSGSSSGSSGSSGPSESDLVGFDSSNYTASNGFEFTDSHGGFIAG